MDSEKLIRCISIEGDKTKFLRPHLGNDDVFLKEIGFMRQELIVDKLTEDKTLEPVISESIAVKEEIIAPTEKRKYKTKK